MSKAEIVNVGNGEDDYLDKKYPEEEALNEPIEQPKDSKENDSNPPPEANHGKLPYKSSSTIIPFEDKSADENGFVQICSGTVDFGDPEQKQEPQKQNKEEENEIQKSACCLLI